MTSLALLPGWVKPASEQTAGLLRELRLELAGGHQLFEVELELIAMRLDCDDILVRVPGQDKYFVVHLTWISKPDRPPFPTTEMSGTWDEFRAWNAKFYD